MAILLKALPILYKIRKAAITTRTGRGASSGWFRAGHRPRVAKTSPPRAANSAKADSIAAARHLVFSCIIVSPSWICGKNTDNIPHFHSQAGKRHVNFRRFFRLRCRGNCDMISTGKHIGLPKEMSTQSPQRPSVSECEQSQGGGNAGWRADDLLHARVRSSRAIALTRDCKPWVNPTTHSPYGSDVS